jgi:hypothetical protein
MGKKVTSNSRHSLFGPPLVLEGEDAAAYDELMERLYAAVEPVGVLDEMLIDDLVASEWEFLRWCRLKLRLVQACAANGLKEFLDNNLDFDVYRERFEKDLREILEDCLPKGSAEDVEKLARDCALDEPSADDKVNEILSKSVFNIDRIVDFSRADRAEELVKEYLRREAGTVTLIDNLLAKAGTTIDALIASHLPPQLEYIERVDRLASVAEARRNASLREIDRRRPLGEKVRRSMLLVENDYMPMIERSAGDGNDGA